MPRVKVEKCKICGRGRGERHIATTKRPTIEKLEKWSFDGVAMATDGCQVEPDGECEHGHLSWMLVMGVI